MFYDVYTMLCANKGVSESKAAEANGLNRSAVVKWKNGSIPGGVTLQTLAEYFGVSTDYLMGFTLEAQIDATAHKLRHLQAALDFADEADREEIEYAIAVLEESLSDLSLVAQLTQKEKAPTQQSGERSMAQNEVEEEILLLARHMEPLSAEDRKTLTDQFRSHIDLYLKARGLSGMEDK